MSPYYEDRPDEVCPYSDRQLFFLQRKREYQSGKVAEAMEAIEKYWTERRARGKYSAEDLAEIEATELDYVKERR